MSKMWPRLADKWKKSFSIDPSFPFSWLQGRNEINLAFNNARKLEFFLPPILIALLVASTGSLPVVEAQHVACVV